MSKNLKWLHNYETKFTPFFLALSMAADTIGLLDMLDINSAHLVGASMGGAIAQTMAIEHPDRVRSLTSMMSTTGNMKVGVTRQAIASVASGDRTELLGHLDLPALIIHGTDDVMCDVSGGRATAAAIPQSKLVLIKVWGITFHKGRIEAIVD
jgi:pimeloyl-ACP methyl ester carboxylesterase